ncbi:MAG: hypothetical protein ACK514_17015 [Bacteroidota bacterium]
MNKNSECLIKKYRYSFFFIFAPALKKPITIAKQYVKPLSLVAIAFFLLLSPCQLLSNASFEDTLELEECFLTADEVENFSEYKTAEASGAAYQSSEGEWVKHDQPIQIIFKNQQPPRDLREPSYKVPRNILFRVFRI